MAVLQDGFFLKAKDTKRTFSKTVKDILWAEAIAKTDNPKCPNPTKNKKCLKFLKYEDAQVDHKHPWSKGGKTKIENSQLLCSKCNSSKGNKTVTQKSFQDKIKVCGRNWSLQMICWVSRC